LEEILRISDRIAVMHEGNLTGVVRRAEANEEAIMRLAVGNQYRER
jgi:ribose transport system ATP-binding protein